MAPQKLTDYERQRLENIRRNDEMMAALKIHSKANDLSASAKRQRAETKSYRKSPEKKVKIEAPIVIRRSLRTRGIAPHSDGVKDDLVESPSKTPKPSYTSVPSPPVSGPLSTRDAYRGDASDRILIETLVGVSKKSKFDFSNEGSGDSKMNNSVEGSDGKGDVFSCVVNGKGHRVVGSLDLKSLALEPDNIARIIPNRIMNVKFLPVSDMNMIVAGNKLGDIAFWNVDATEDEGDGIYLYHPHTGPVSGISIQPSSFSKIFTSCYDGFIRSMDAEKEVFDLVYCSEESIFSLSQQPNNRNCLYFSEGKGGLNVLDERAGKSSSSWMLHEGRINTIDFNPTNTNNFVTSSTDGTACIWDLRSISANKPKTLKTHQHDRAVHSAYFSPSGNCLATTSIDNTVAILSGASFEDVSKIKHDNQTGRWISPFRGIWGWDDSHVFIGNMKRGIDILSTARKTVVKTLWSEHMTAIQARFAAHPFKVGMLAGATGGGQIYIWTSC